MTGWRFHSEGDGGAGGAAVPRWQTDRQLHLTFADMPAKNKTANANLVS